MPIPKVMQQLAAQGILQVRNVSAFHSSAWPDSHAPSDILAEKAPPVIDGTHGTAMITSGAYTCFSIDTRACADEA